jgi:TonB family protein
MVYVMSTGIIRSDWVGQVIDGRFTLLEWLGDSERSSDFLTELPGEGSRKAAIKLIPAVAGAEARLDLWSRASALSHPHLMRLLYTGLCPSAAGPLLYAVTEYAEENLSQVLPERPLTPAETAEMLPPILDALSYLHERGLVQGSLKPSNILVVNDQIKLSSDCLQRAGSRNSGIPAPRIYDAPEYAAGAITPATDLWALGVTLVEALSQHPPKWERSAGGEPIIPESLPQPFAAIARECLRSDPARRCTLKEVKARLHINQPSTQSSSAKRSWLALAAGAFVLLAVLSVLFLRSHPSEPVQPAGEQQSAPTMAAPPAPAPALTPIPETQSPQDATVKGAVAEQVLPDVPPKASSTIRGKVEISVRVTVDHLGTVTNAELDSPATSKYFGNLALQAARRWRFRPAQVAGRAVSSEWALHFHFTQVGAEVTPVETAP